MAVLQHAQPSNRASVERKLRVKGQKCRNTDGNQGDKSFAEKTMLKDSTSVKSQVPIYLTQARAIAMKDK